MLARRSMRRSTVRLRLWEPGIGRAVLSGRRRLRSASMRRGEGPLSLLSLLSLIYRYYFSGRSRRSAADNFYLEDGGPLLSGYEEAVPLGVVGDAVQGGFF